jgi:hypothetical protein
MVAERELTKGTTLLCYVTTSTICSNIFVLLQSKLIFYFQYYILYYITNEGGHGIYGTRKNY